LRASVRVIDGGHIAPNTAHLALVLSTDDRKIVVVLRRVFVPVEIEASIIAFCSRASAMASKMLMTSRPVAANALRRRRAKVDGTPEPACVTRFLDTAPDAFDSFDFGYLTSDMVRSSRKAAGRGLPRLRL
jgi:hypothetical protein